MPTDTTHTVLASVPLNDLLYTVVAEVSWFEADPIFGKREDAQWVCRLLEVRYRQEGSEVWHTLPEWAEPKYSIRQTLEDAVTLAMDEERFEKPSDFDRVGLRLQHFPEGIEYLLQWREDKANA